MIARLSSLAVVLLLGLVLFYLSQFWPFRWWSNQGLFGIEAIRPQGDLVSRWLRGTPFAPYDLLVWAIGAILTLSAVQTFFDRFKK